MKDAEFRETIALNTNAECVFESIYVVEKK